MTKEVLDVSAALRLPLADRRSSKPVDDLTKRIVQLITSHHLEVSFRNGDIAEMDEQTKRTLLRNVEAMVDDKRLADRTP